MYIVQLEIGTEKSIENLSFIEVMDILEDIPANVEYSMISNKFEIIGSNFFIKIESEVKNILAIYENFNAFNRMAST